VAELAMARIARRNGSLSSGQASMTFRKSGQAGEIGALIGASEVEFPRQSAVFGRFETCSAQNRTSLASPSDGKIGNTIGNKLAKSPHLFQKESCKQASYVPY
jgi:hypothetical protein